MADEDQDSRMYTLLSYVRISHYSQTYLMRRKEGNFTAQLHSNYMNKQYEAGKDSSFSKLPTVGDVVQYQYATFDYDGLPIRARIVQTFQPLLDDNNAAKKQSLNGKFILPPQKLMRSRSHTENLTFNWREKRGWSLGG